MKRVIYALAALVALCCACSNEEEVLPQQREKLVSYLESSHARALVEESEADKEARQPFYSLSGSTVYRYIETYYAPGRESRAEVTSSSKVTITFRAYEFAYSNITDSTFPFYSNDPLLEQAYLEAGLTPGAWSFEPLTLDMRGDILKGLRLALLGCRAGDEVEAYMTYNMAFGDRNFGTIPRESPIAWFFTVESVE